MSFTAMRQVLHAVAPVLLVEDVDLRVLEVTGAQGSLFANLTPDAGSHITTELEAGAVDRVAGPTSVV